MRQITKKGSADTAEPNIIAISAQQLNIHYANIFTDPQYEPSLLKSTVSDNKIIFEEIATFNLLDKIKPTSEGLDRIPYWFLRLTAASIARPLTYLINLAFFNSVVPTQWKTSIISPRPKIIQQKTCADYRPISITPILSRLLEKQIARMFLYPILSLSNIFCFFQDQFAFRSTGSTTASLIFLIHSVTSLLQHNQHVHVISFYFSKAFDSVRHHTLFQKMSKYSIPDFLYNWLVSFFTDKAHCTKLGGIISSVLGINASVIQGSGLGPISFVYNASDLHPLNAANKICKYADDFYLIVPSSHSHTILSELEDIANWTKNNNLKLNQPKSHEMIVRKPRTGSSTNPPAITPGIERVREMVVLGVTLTDTLSFRQHVDRIVARTAQTSYALRLLRSHGLGAPQLFDVARATLVAQLTYASPA